MSPPSPHDSETEARDIDGTPARARILPAHIEETVEAIAQLHAEHYERATRLQRVVDGLTSRVGRPEFIASVAVIVVLWIGLNLALEVAGQLPFDGPPFYWLQGAVSLTALFMTSIILATQRREDELAGYREQLTLELGILSEQKAAKIIELLEELRRDMPSVRDRVDPEADELATPANPQAVLEAIKETQDFADSIKAG